MHSDKERQDFTVGRIWNWVSNIKRPGETKVKADVLLNYGYLVENEKVSLPGIGQSMKVVMLLPNCDLVVGPELLSGEDQKVREQLAIETKEFKNDMIYLKRAMVHGTINLDDFPKSR